MGYACWDCPLKKVILKLKEAMTGNGLQHDAATFSAWVNLGLLHTIWDLESLERQVSLLLFSGVYCCLPHVGSSM